MADITDLPVMTRDDAIAAGFAGMTVAGIVAVRRRPV